MDKKEEVIMRVRLFGWEIIIRKIKRRYVGRDSIADFVAPGFAEIIKLCYKDVPGTKGVMIIKKRKRRKKKGVKYES